MSARKEHSEELDGSVRVIETVFTRCRKWVSLFDLPESSHAHRSYRGPGFWGLPQAESAPRAAERRRTGGLPQREERQRFIRRRYTDSTACSRPAALLWDGCVFGKPVGLSSNVGLCADSWVLASQDPGGNIAEKVFLHLQGCVLDNKRHVKQEKEWWNGAGEKPNLPPWMPRHALKWKQNKMWR